MSEREPVSEEQAMRNANGLPQRRRRTPATSPFGAGAQAGRAAAAAASSQVPDARSDKASSSAAEPGLWLAAFQSAVSGDTPPAGSGSRDASSEEGER
jgi:hypothetical protein